MYNLYIKYFEYLLFLDYQHVSLLNWSQNIIYYFVFFNRKVPSMYYLPFCTPARILCVTGSFMTCIQLNR